MAAENGERGAAVARELRWINWLLLVVYSIAATTIVFRELLFECPFYPEPFRFYFGLIALPAFVPAWFGYLLADIIHRFRWEWLAASIAAGTLMLGAYFVIAKLTFVPG